MVAIDVISNMQLFQACSRSLLEPIAEIMNSVFFDEGQVVFRRGDAGGSLFFIRSGRVDVIWEISEYRKFILTSIEPGDFFGEMAILENNPRSATVMAVEPLDTLSMGRDDFYSLISDHPYSGLALVKGIGTKLSNRLRLLNEHLLFTEATLKMLDQKNKEGEVHDLSQEEAASITRNLDQDTFDFLKTCGEERSLEAGEVIISEGGAHREFYILLEGRVEVSKSMPSGDKVVLTALGPGNLFGEMAFLDNEFRSAEVSARSPVKLCVFREDHMNRLIKEDINLITRIYLAIIRKISFDIRMTNRHYIASKRLLLGVPG